MLAASSEEDRDGWIQVISECMPNISSFLRSSHEDTSVPEDLGSIASEVSYFVYTHDI